MSDLLRSPKAKIGIDAWRAACSSSPQCGSCSSRRSGRRRPTGGQVTPRGPSSTQRRTRARAAVGERDGEARRPLPAHEGAAERDRHAGHPARREPARRRNGLKFTFDHAVGTGARHRLRRSSRSTSSVQGRFGNVSRLPRRPALARLGSPRTARRPWPSLLGLADRHQPRPTAGRRSRSSRPR